jgi:hypothetical protein
MESKSKKRKSDKNSKLFVAHSASCSFIAIGFLLISWLPAGVGQLEIIPAKRLIPDL